METIAAAVAARHGIPPADVHPLPAGVANHVLALGDALVLRVPRGPDFEADLRKEAALIPVVRAAGVRTPALVEFRDGAMLLERVPGTDLVGRDPGVHAAGPTPEDIRRRSADVDAGRDVTSAALDDLDRMLDSE